MSARSRRPFPYWLYDTSLIGYAGRLWSGAAIEHALQRVAIGLGLRKRIDPTGTFNSEDIWPAGQFLEKNYARRSAGGGRRRHP